MPYPCDMMPAMSSGATILHEAVRKSSRRLLKINVPILAYALFGVATAGKAFKSENLGFIALSGFGFMLWPGGLVAIWNLIKVWRRSRNPALHPDFARLKRYGDPEAMAVEADQAARGGPWLVNGANLFITPTWYIFVRPGGFDAFRVGDLAWIYASTFTEKVNGVVINQANSLVLHTCGGARSGVNVGTKEAVTRTISALADLVPWVATGWSSDLSGRWKSAQGEFIADVERARRAAGR